MRDEVTMGRDVISSAVEEEDTSDLPMFILAVAAREYLTIDGPKARHDFQSGVYTSHLLVDSSLTAVRRKRTQPCYVKRLCCIGKCDVTRGRDVFSRLFLGGEWTQPCIVKFMLYLMSLEVRSGWWRMMQP